MSESARRSLWNADEQGTDDGCAHRTHIEASSQRRQTRRTCESSGQVVLGASERVLRVAERARQRQFSGTLQHCERSRRDVGASLPPLRFGESNRSRDESGRHDSGDDESAGEDHPSCGRNDGDDSNRSHAHDGSDEGRQQCLDDDVSHLVDVRTRARHEVAASQRRQRCRRGLGQLIVEVTAQRVHAR